MPFVIGPRGGPKGNFLGNGGLLILGKGGLAPARAGQTFHCPSARNSGLTNHWNQAPTRAQAASPRPGLAPDGPGTARGWPEGWGLAKRSQPRAASDGGMERASVGWRAVDRVAATSEHHGGPSVAVWRWNSSQNVGFAPLWVPGLADFLDWRVPACRFVPFLPFSLRRLIYGSIAFAHVIGVQ